MDEDGWFIAVVLVLYLPAAIFVAAVVLFLRGAHDPSAAAEFASSLEADPAAPALLTLISVTGWASFALYYNALTGILA